MFEHRDVHRRGVAQSDPIAIEEPLEIRVEGSGLAVLMRTPGADRELAAGFLLTEAVIESLADLSALAEVEENVLDCRLAAGVEAHRAALDHARRDLLSHGGCGICGKQRIEQVALVASVEGGSVSVTDAVVGTLPDRLRSAQPGFVATGGLHAAALMTPDGTLLVAREDIGRHNAVDKVIGWRLLQDALPIHDAILVVSSRAGFEIVQKARMAGIGTVVALGAASTLAVDLARAHQMGLIGFAKRDGFNRYS